MLHHKMLLMTEANAMSYISNHRQRFFNKSTRGDVLKNNTASSRNIINDKKQMHGHGMTYASRIIYDASMYTIKVHVRNVYI